jgi:hypothetical protein
LGEDSSWGERRRCQIGGTAGAVIALAALIVEIRSKNGEADNPKVPLEAKSIPCGELGRVSSESSAPSDDVTLAA